MSGKTKIDWCDSVWNVVTGCTKVSEGCRNCYAEKIANRFWGGWEIPTGEIDYTDETCPLGMEVYRRREFTDVMFHEDRLDLPARWKKPQTIFVTSMGDLFHPDVPDVFIFKVLMAMHLANDRPPWLRHTFILLTKRPERMSKYLAGAPIPNLWLGVSVEDQATADERIPLLLQTPAAKRIVSVEPMLEKIYLDDIREKDTIGRTSSINALVAPEKHLFWTDTHPRIDWVIAGCESGAHRRPCNPDWLRSLRDQCISANVPFFLKSASIDGKVIKTPMIDGKRWMEFPR